MSFKNRVILLSVFFILFIIGSIFIIFNSLGYSFDIKTGKIKNSFSLTINTYPSKAKVELTAVKGNFETPVNISLDDTTNTIVTLTKEDFSTDSFTANSPRDKNSSVVLDKIYLAPTKAEEVYKGEQVALLSNNYTIDYNQSKVLIKQITTESSNELPQIVSTIETVFPSIRNWKKLSDNYYINSQYLLVRSSNSWVLEKPIFLSQPYKNIALTSAGNLLILSEQNVLTLVKIQSKEIEGVAQGVQNIFQDAITKVIWVEDQEGIYKWNDDRLEYKKENNKIVDLLTISKLKLIKNSDSFKLVNFFSGKLLFYNNSLFYISDFDKLNPILITNDAINVTTSSNTYATTVFWITSSKELMVQNFELNYRKKISSLESTPVTSDDNLVYNERWRRVIIYGQNSTHSFPYELNTNNESIVNYTTTLWLNNQKCEINYNFEQFCYNNKSVLRYTNKLLF